MVTTGALMEMLGIDQDQRSKITNNWQDSNRDYKYLFISKQESSKTKVAREGSTKIETRVLTPKSLRSRISS
jgi:hypothetical protein